MYSQSCIVYIFFLTENPSYVIRFSALHNFNHFQALWNKITFVLCFFFLRTLDYTTIIFQKVCYTTFNKMLSLLPCPPQKNPILSQM